MNAPPPDFSVIVTTFERPGHLPRLLEALAAQHIPRERFEVIVVNDGGAEPLDPVLAPFAGRLDLHLFAQAHAGPGAGRNLGLAYARGRFIAFTDDDCEPAPQWLSALKDMFDIWPEVMAGGGIVNGAAHRPCSEASQLISKITYGFYNTDPENARMFWSNNMAAPAALLRALGGFDARFRIAAEDRDLCERWRHAGNRMVFSPEAIVRHHHDLNLRAFCGQHFRYGRGAALFHRLRSARGSSRLAEHTAFHRAWYTWPLLAWRRAPGWRGVRLTALLAAWQAFNTAGFLYGRLRDRVHLENVP
jgi:GT2 family glycosyltransferase